MSAQITVTGNLVGEPTTRQTRAGVAVTNFRIASTDRRFDKSTQQWVDGNSFYANVACWRHLAQNTFGSLKKGMPVIVTGRIATRTWTDTEEQSHTTYEIDADSVAPDLSWGTASFTRVPRNALPPVPLDADGVPAGYSFDNQYDAPTLVEEHPEPVRDLVGAAS